MTTGNLPNPGGLVVRGGNRNALVHVCAYHVNPVRVAGELHQLGARLQVPEVHDAVVVAAEDTQVVEVDDAIRDGTCVHVEGAKHGPGLHVPRAQSAVDGPTDAAALLKVALAEGDLGAVVAVDRPQVSQPFRVPDAHDALARASEDPLLLEVRVDGGERAVLARQEGVDQLIGLQIP
eukprot:CAMPEP_0183589872 /NCGR_PEP_ID=MMETSP0371-20130417/163541_1 /TAXON_ID=268820 /ORGANISM="Peridinium aciculiferum, Strain PAER-2" /LENGTH=177 /DNA_ID=CAMNT_0025801223 /DNA_START=251 /DNA_END=784 /DNA_ORIENTATION=+